MTSILVQEHGGGLGVRGALVIATTEGPRSFRPAITRRVVDEIARLRRTSHQDRLVYVYVAGEEANVPDAESRRIAAELAQHLDTVVGVHEGDGFRASAIRAIVTGISLLQPRRVSPKIVETVQAASAYLHARHPDLGSEQDIADAIEDVRTAARATL